MKLKSAALCIISLKLYSHMQEMKKLKQPNSLELSVLNFLMLFIQERNMLKENDKSTLGMHQNLDPDSGITEMSRFSPMNCTQNWSNIATGTLLVLPRENCQPT